MLEDKVEARKEVLLYCDQVLNKSFIICNQTDKHPASKKIAEQLKKRTEIIKEICSIDKYNLCFMGFIGTGKSTFIATLLNLINYNKLQINGFLDKCLLLKVGHGHTTICDTKVSIGSKISYFKVIGASSDKFRNYLKDYIDYLYNINSVLTDEEKNIIRNMLHISNKEIAEEKIREFLELPDTLPSDKDYFVSKLYKKVQYSKRIKTEFVYDHSISFYDWFKKFSVEINDGKLEDCPFPLKIEIYLSCDDLNIQIPEFIDSIIDTKGLDIHDGDRSDIQNFLKSNENISIFCDLIDTFGSNANIHSILKQVLTLENRDTKHKVFLCGLERNDALNHISSYTTREEAAMIRVKSAIDSFKESKINFKNSNIFFQKTAPGLETNSDTGKIYDIQTNLATILSEERFRFFEFIKMQLLDMYRCYRKELLDYLNTFYLLLEDRMTEEIVAKFKEAYNIACIIRKEAQNRQQTLATKFKEVLSTIYPASIRGAVNHNGIGNVEDIFQSFQKCGENIFTEECKKFKDEMAGAFKKIFSDCDEISQICYKCIDAKLTDSYDMYYNECGKKFYDYTFALNSDNSAWALPQSYWGDSKHDYRGRVATDILNEIESRHIDEKLKELDFQNKFFDDIICYLDLD